MLVLQRVGNPPAHLLLCRDDRHPASSPQDGRRLSSHSSPFLQSAERGGEIFALPNSSPSARGRLAGELQLEKADAEEEQRAEK